MLLTGDATKAALSNGSKLVAIVVGPRFADVS